MLRTIKPKNARSKRALEAREPKEIEDARTAVFVKGTHAGQVVTNVMKDLMSLKRQDAISFSKKNVIRPFEDASSLEFWSQKNDASLFVVGQTTKKRPNGLIFARMFEGRLLDMCELGVEKFVPMSDFKNGTATPGHKPMMHFASDLWDTHPRFVQLKSLLISFFNGQVIEELCLAGLEHVISISLAPTPASFSSTTHSNSALDLASAPQEDPSTFPHVHIRIYTISLHRSGTRVPRIALKPMGPSLDLSLRRHTQADPDMWAAATKKPKMKKQEVEKGLGKKRKNLEVDEMGDLRGRVHVGRQDLGKLQTRKMKGLKKRFDAEDEAEDGGDDSAGEEEDEPVAKKKRRKSNEA